LLCLALLRLSIFCVSPCCFLIVGSSFLPHISVHSS
jgi:hypothetical protein